MDGGGPGAYLVVRDICNDGILAKYRLAAHLPALALGATGLSMAYMLGFPSWTKAAALLYGPQMVLELLHMSATENCTKLNRWVNALTPIWTLLLAVILPQALQTHTRRVTHAAARPAARHAERMGTTTSQRGGALDAGQQFLREVSSRLRPDTSASFSEHECKLGWGGAGC
ncbi:MAG: hypothetical protein QW086_02130 [Pyrobaculum sp.]